MQRIATRRGLGFVLACVLLVASLGGCGRSYVTADASHPEQVSGRPAKWAKPVSAPGLDNTFQVSENLYRGGQPTAEGFASLKAMGVKTIVCIRSSNPDPELIAGTGLSLEWISMSGLNADDAANAKLFSILNDKSRGPFFVHCMHGSDRTGQAMAMYRVAVQGWSREEAIQEMTKGGYGFLPVLQNLVYYVSSADVAPFRPKNVASAQAPVLTRTASNDEQPAIAPF